MKSSTFLKFNYQCHCLSWQPHTRKQMSHLRRRAIVSRSYGQDIHVYDTFHFKYPEICRLTTMIPAYCYYQASAPLFATLLPTGHYNTAPPSIGLDDKLLHLLLYAPARCLFLLFVPICLTQIHLPSAAVAGKPHSLTQCILQFIFVFCSSFP